MRQVPTTMPAMSTDDVAPSSPPPADRMSSSVPAVLHRGSYGKILLTPGQRLGYIALPPTLPNREEMRQAIQAVQVAGGWLFPNAIMQHAIAEL